MAQGVVGSDSVVPDLVVTASGGALDAGAEASDKQVVDVVMLFRSPPLIVVVDKQKI